MISLLRKKTAWVLLIILFIFDNVVSYFAIKYWGGHEGNFLIAFIVEKYPLLYFLCIPLEIVIVFLIIWTIEQVLLKIFKKWQNRDEVLERIILWITVIYWAVANSSMNLFFLIGLRLPVKVWLFTSILRNIFSINFFLFCAAIDAETVKKLVASYQGEPETDCHEQWRNFRGGFCTKCEQESK